MESVIFSVDGRRDLIKAIEELAFTQLRECCPIFGQGNPQSFSDGEVCFDFKTSVRGKRVFLLSSPDTSDKLMQLNFAIDAAKRAAAAEIVPIIPYFPYARQDKKDQLRGPIGAKVIAEMLENRGATHVVTFDLHADQIQGFFNIPVTHMEGKYLFDRYIYDIYNEHSGDNTVLCAPDAGAAKRVKQFRDQIKERWDIDLPIVHIDKTRKKANEIDTMVIIGDVKDKSVLIIDDMCDTGGTLVKAADELLEAGAQDVRAIVTHGILSGQAVDRIYNSNLEDFVCSDTLQIQECVNHTTIKTSGFITQITVARQITKAIRAINLNESVDVLKHKD